MLGRNLDDAEEWVRSWTAQVSARADAAATLAQRVSSISATATGADGAVRVTVDSSGVVTALDLDDRVQRIPATELAREIMAVMRRAQARLTDQVAVAVGETVGADSESGRGVVTTFAQRFPGRPDGDDPEPREERRGE